MASSSSDEDFNEFKRKYSQKNEDRKKSLKTFHNEKTDQLGKRSSFPLFSLIFFISFWV